MARAVLFALIPVFAGLVLSKAQAQDEKFVVGKPIPNFQLQGVHSTLTPDTFLGKPFVIVVVGKTMAQSFMRSMLTQAKLFSQTHGDSAYLLFVVNEPSEGTANADNTPEGIVKRMNHIIGLTTNPIDIKSLPPFALALNTFTPKGNGFVRTISTPGLPRTFIVDKKGVLIHSRSGWTDEGRDPETGRTWWGNYTAREVWRQLGRHDMARQEVDRLSALFSRQPELEVEQWLNKLYTMGVYDEPAASRYFRQICMSLYKDDPNEQMTLCWRLITLDLLREPDYKQVVHVAEHALSLTEKDTPKYVRALDTLATMYYMSEQLDKAVEWIDKAAAAGETIAGVSKKAKSDIKFRQDLFRKVKKDRGG